MLTGRNKAEQENEDGTHWKKKSEQEGKEKRRWGEGWLALVRQRESRKMGPASLYPGEYPSRLLLLKPKLLNEQMSSFYIKSEYFQRSASVLGTGVGESARAL